ILGVEHHGHGLAEDGVAEKLEPFVVRQAAVFVRERAVGQGQLEQLGAERHTELSGQSTDAWRSWINETRRLRPCGPCTPCTEACRRSLRRPSRGAEGCKRSCRSRWS